MPRGPGVKHAMRTGVIVGLIALALLLAAKLHACACTGGPAEWRSVSSSTN